MFLAAIIACVQKFDASFLKICALNISLEELFPTQKRESNEENT
jgi:hypothetical protein